MQLAMSMSLIVTTTNVLNINKYRFQVIVWAKTEAAAQLV